MNGKQAKMTLIMQEAGKALATSFSRLCGIQINKYFSRVNLKASSYLSFNTLPVAEEGWAAVTPRLAGRHAAALASQRRPFRPPLTSQLALL